VGSKQNASGFARRPWAQSVSLERLGHRSNKNSSYQIYEGRLQKIVVRLSAVDFLFFSNQGGRLEGVNEANVLKCDFFDANNVCMI
jgi:hypothetical protein